ncbi:hypothetical protein HYALB_00011487 [Hymenoscyphus albidus]|uniref:O-methyltransferase C-terminal domain-containing protein n=1 Tax=Hymenoscyphus albidus TaxID=595503 RepID=A0A9N9LVB0_9HELO|nr:hypothetical protein HYALB_00011487 [Hymenoscyphus albidus]
MISNNTRIRELTTIVSTHTQKIDDYLLSHNKPTPSFDVGCPELDLPEDLQASRELVIDATTELKELLQGPKQFLLSNPPNYFVSLHAIYRYNIEQTFPVGGEATFDQVSKVCGLNEPDVRRVLRHAMAHHIFREPRKGIVAHTAFSQMLAENSKMKAWMGALADDIWPSAVQTVPAMIKWPNSQEPNHTGFSKAHDTQDSMYLELGKDPKRAARFGQGMSAFAADTGFAPHYLIDYELWSSLKEGTVVDLGGSHGGSMIALATKYKSLKFVVQDLPSTIDSRPSLPEDLANRITFMSHDFLTEQPVKNAEVYYFRRVFHNWPDTYCIRMLRNLIPALKQHARIVINDACLPEPGTLPLMAERRLRALDLTMLTIQNSREREAHDWKALFEQADPRFKFQGIKQPMGSELAFILASWEPGSDMGDGLSSASLVNGNRAPNKD